MSAIAFRSSRGITPPVGFCGELSTTILVRSLRRSRNRFRSKEKPRLSSSGIGTGVAPQKPDHRFVNREAGVGVDHFVARLQQRQHGEEDDRLAAGDHRDVLRAHLNSAGARDVGGDGLAQFGLALGRTVMGPALVERLLGRFDDVRAVWGNRARRSPGESRCAPALPAPGRAPARRKPIRCRCGTFCSASFIAAAPSLRILLPAYLIAPGMGGAEAILAQRHG